MPDVGLKQMARTRALKVGHFIVEFAMDLDGITGIDRITGQEAMDIADDPSTTYIAEDLVGMIKWYSACPNDPVATFSASPRTGLLNKRGLSLDYDPS